MRRIRVVVAGVALGTSFAAMTPAAAMAGQEHPPAAASGSEPARPAWRGQPVKSIEFVGMSAPATPEQKASVYSAAKAKLTYQGGGTETVDLAYHQLMATGEKINGKVVGGLYDAAGKPLMDARGQIASDGPDGTSLIKLDGMQAATPSRNNGLALVTQYEYRGLPPVGPGFTEKDYWSKLPATMSLARVDQDKHSGALTVTDYATIGFAAVQGLWIPCAASLSPWNTHLGSEEYEPDAKVREGLAPAKDTEDNTDIASFSTYYFGDPKKANAYNYGVVPEVKVGRDGKTNVTKHYALGRIAREVADVQADGRTAYMGDDGAFTGLFMFVADKRGDLSAGTLYAGKWSQVSQAGAAGGTAKLDWIRLGHGTDAEIKAMVDGGITFSDIFAVSNTDPGDPSYTKVQTYTGTEWLKLKPGKEKAAAFLETRRYAALLGATTEFNKMEGITHDTAGKVAYVAMSRIEKGMSDTAGHIKLAENKGGGVYQMRLGAGARDTNGGSIASDYVAGTMAIVPETLGKYSSKADANGNKCDQNHVCGPDNIKFSPGMRTLFIGEDTGYRNNNYVWAYHVDTKKLSRILSVPMGAEATGLQAVDDYNGSAYLMSNFQHPGEFGSTDPEWAKVSALINSKWNNRLKTAIGYVGTVDGALPAVK